MGHAANEVSEIPEYLTPYIVQQDSSLYTSMDHASWRFILKLSQDFFAKHAHQKYLDGLSETGISVDRIPLIQEMDKALGRFGWRAVAVSGFIPPGVFMEFLALGILPIACDMRSLEHLAYTPAPDIVHEAAGHAPIIADPDYARYLKSYGEISRKAIYSSKDMAVYHAIRELSEVKEDPKSTIDQIAESQKRLESAVSDVDYVSEAAELSRMGWWTFEYGLVGSLADPKIYGAGLLSSIGESYHCLGAEVKKLPLSLQCIVTDYDITRPQPQLFVAKDFSDLIQVLEHLANRMSFRIGGLDGLSRAKKAGTVTTVQLESGVQVSGVLSNYRLREEKPYYLQFAGPVQIAADDEEFSGQGAEYHKTGFSSPIGPLLDGRSPVELSEDDLRQGYLRFRSGVEVSGAFHSLTRKFDKTLIVTFKDCTVRKGDEILFRPEWGTFDMICGQDVVSVFGGAADRKKFLAATGGFHQMPGKPKTNLTEKNRPLNELYSRLRALRDRGVGPDLSELESIHEELESSFPTDWLLRWELLEVSKTTGVVLPFERRLRERLGEISRISKDRAEMIQRGLALIAV